MEKGYLKLLNSTMVIAILILLFNDRTRDDVFTVLRTMAKEVEKGQSISNLTNSIILKGRHSLSSFIDIVPKEK